MDRTEDIKRIKLLIKQVNVILTERWDPIGMKGEDPEIAYTEYESYAPKIAGMIFNGDDECKIAKELERICTIQMGMDGASTVNRDVAVLLVRLRDDQPDPGTH